MKKFYLLILTIWASLASLNAQVAFWGGQLFYTHNGNGVYSIYLDVYLDCQGDTLINNDSLIVNRTSGGYFPYILTNRTKVLEQDITGLSDSCSGFAACGQGSYPFGIKLHRYEYSLDLSQDTICDFYLHWKKHRWTSQITTGYANTEAGLVAGLNKCHGNVNSPQFTKTENAIYEKGHDAAISFNAQGAGLDSISYTLVLPTVYNVTNWPMNFNQDRPLTFFGYPNQNLQLPAGFHLDLRTGLVMFRPTVENQIAVVAVEAKGWKRVSGVMQPVGSVIRNQPVIVSPQDSTNSAPRAVVQSSKRFGCLGDTMWISYELQDLDSNQQLTVNPVVTRDRVSWSVDYSQTNPVLRIEWVPNLSDIGTEPTFDVSFEVVDNHCPIAGSTPYRTTFGASLKPTADVTFVDNNCGNISVVFQNEQNIQNRGWYAYDSILQDYYYVSLTNPDRFLPGDHLSQIILYNDFCQTYLFDTIAVRSYVVPNLLVNPTTYCPNTNIVLKSGVSGNHPSNVFIWTWKGNSYQDSAGSFSFSADSTWIYVRVIDSIGCETDDSLKIGLHPELILSAGLDSTLCSDNGVLIHYSFNPLLTYSWWDESTNNSVLILQSGKYWLNVSDSNACSAIDSFDIVIYPLPQPDLGSDINICSTDSVFLDAGANYVSYDWADGFTGQTRWVSNTANYSVWVRDSVGCLNSDTVLVERFSGTPLYLGNDTMLCWTDSLLLDANGFTSYVWNDQSTQAQRWVNQAGTYSVVATDSNSCIASDTLVLSINKPDVQIYGDSIFCAGDSTALHILQTYPLVIWSTGDTANSTYVSSSGMTYVLISDSLGCRNGASFYAWEFPLPSAGFTYIDLGGRMIQFNAADTLMEYTWTFGDGDSSFVDDPSHHYSAVQSYTVQLVVVDDFGCSNTSSQTISFNTGISGLENSVFEVYPNPSNGKLSINWNGEPIELMVLDQLGKQHLTLNLATGLNTYNLDLAPGVYLLTDKNHTMKAVKIQIVE